MQLLSERVRSPKRLLAALSHPSLIQGYSCAISELACSTDSQTPRRGGRDCSLLVRGGPESMVRTTGLLCCSRFCDQAETCKAGIPFSPPQINSLSPLYNFTIFPSFIKVWGLFFCWAGGGCILVWQFQPLSVTPVSQHMPFHHLFRLHPKGVLDNPFSVFYISKFLLLLSY